MQSFLSLKFNSHFSSHRQNAYLPGIAPHLTQADIERLQEQFSVTIQTFSQSGVGALPLLSIPTPATPISVLPQISSEEDLLSSITMGLQILYDEEQENVNVVGNLLGFFFPQTFCPNGEVHRLPWRNVTGLPFDLELSQLRT